MMPGPSPGSSSGWPSGGATAARWEADTRDHPHEAGLLQVDAAKARARLGWAPRLTPGRGPGLDRRVVPQFGAGGDAAVITLGRSIGTTRSRKQDQ